MSSKVTVRLSIDCMATCNWRATAFRFCLETFSSSFLISVFRIRVALFLDTRLRYILTLFIHNLPQRLPPRPPSVTQNGSRPGSRTGSHAGSAKVANVLLGGHVSMTNDENDHDDVTIHVRRAPSTTDTIRRSSEPRILSQADLRFAEHIDVKQAFEGSTKSAKSAKSATLQAPADLGASEGDIDRDPLGGDDGFTFSHGITTGEAEKRLVLYGPNMLPEKIIPKVR